MDRKELYNRYLANTLRSMFNSEKSYSNKHFTQKAEEKRIRISKRRKANKAANIARKKNRKK